MRAVSPLFGEKRDFLMYALSPDRQSTSSFFPGPLSSPAPVKDRENDDVLLAGEFHRALNDVRDHGHQILRPMARGRAPRPGRPGHRANNCRRAPRPARARGRSCGARACGRPRGTRRRPRIRPSGFSIGTKPKRFSKEKPPRSRGDRTAPGGTPVRWKRPGYHNIRLAFQTSPGVVRTAVRKRSA